MTRKIGSLLQISAKYSNFFFDLDGVIWRGSHKIQGGIEALNFLRTHKKNVFFVTNSSIRNRLMLKQRLHDFGFDAQLQQIFPSDYATSLYLQTNYPQIKKIVAVGAHSLVQQLSRSGIEVVHMDSIPFEPGEAIESLISKIDKSIDALVLGYDFNLTYQKICLISFFVQTGIKFIATNPDKYTMIGDFKVPGNGSFLKLIEEATSVKGEVVGKPNPFIIEHIINKLHLDKTQCLMIGDNLETDIAFGIRAGINTLCVLTGVSTEAMVLQSSLPTYYTSFLMQ